MPTAQLVYHSSSREESKELGQFLSVRRLEAVLALYNCSLPLSHLGYIVCIQIALQIMEEIHSAGTTLLVGFHIYSSSFSQDLPD